MKNIILRNYHTTDFNRYIQLHIETEKLDRSGRYISARVLAEDLGRPNYFPEKNVFVAESENKIIGCISITMELGIRRALLDCLVHPRYRKRGTASKLFALALQRAKDSKMGVAQINIPQTHAAAESLVTRLGFRYIRRFLELKLDLYNIRLHDVKATPFISRGLLPGEEEMLKKIQNRSFENTWGFNPNTNEGIVYQLKRSGGSPEDVVLTFLGDKPVGYCWTRINTEENEARGVSKSQILMLGVHPDFRKRGIGKHVLLTGLSYLKGKGIDTVELTTDSENQAARSLYDKAGFKMRSITKWYEKGLT